MKGKNRHIIENVVSQSRHGNVRHCGCFRFHFFHRDQNTHFFLHRSIVGCLVLIPASRDSSVIIIHLHKSHQAKISIRSGTKWAHRGRERSFVCTKIFVVWFFPFAILLLGWLAPTICRLTGNLKCANDCDITLWCFWKSEIRESTGTRLFSEIMRREERRTMNVCEGNEEDFRWKNHH